jgi:anti-sigma B factor antagonist
MKVEHVQKGKVLLVTPNESRLDAGVAHSFKSKMSELVEAGHADIVIDLSKVTLIDSSGLGVLVSIMKKIGEKGEIRLCGLRDNIKSLFQLTRLDKVFAIYHSQAEAVESFNG